MPAILSHHLFGREHLARENNRAFITRDARDAFLLGNQGPDPLFFATRTHLMVPIKTLGSRMHHELIPEYLEVWRKLLFGLYNQKHTQEILQAYIYGFLCHYNLDRAAHPLVFAYQNAICHAGVEGLGVKDGSFVHAQIESDLDVYMLHRLTGRTIEEYSIPKQVLLASHEVLSMIDTLYVAAAREFSLKVPNGVFSRSVKDMRMVIRMIYSPGGSKRMLFGRLERLARSHSLLQALSHRPEAFIDNWYANEDKAPWLYPESRKESTQSFIELFNGALTTAKSNIELFSAGAPMEEITQGMDFSGKTAHEKADE